MHNPNDKLEHYLVLARDAKGQSAAELCEQATNDPQLHVFSELLHAPGISSLSDDPIYGYAYRLLRLFSYGTYTQWAEQPDRFPPLSSEQLAKLRTLSLVSLAAGRTHLGYSDLMSALGMASIREMEEFVLESSYSGLITIRLDQCAQRVLVLSVVGRDVNVESEEVDKMKQTLLTWKSKCEQLLETIDARISYVTAETQRRRRVQLENEEKQRTVRNIVRAADSRGMSNTRPRNTQENAAELMDSDHTRQMTSLPGGRRGIGSRTTRSWT